tara:strand:+ start:379 stop:609 length:231 start_codon:yes stop_codon:yes gene_type:complete
MKNPPLDIENPTSTNQHFSDRLYRSVGVFRSWFSSGQPFKPLAGGISKLMLFLTGGSFTVIGVQSFVWARKKPEEE